jgi:peroxidase
LNSAKDNEAENDALFQLMIKGFDVVDAVKNAVEKKCSNVVSCENIIAN